MQRRRMFVTGLGLMSPLGKGVASSWEKLTQGKTGIVPWPEEALAVGRCSEVNAADLKRICASSPRALEPRFISLALLAAEEALQDAQLSQDHLNALERNVAVVIGCGMGAATSEIPVAIAAGSPRKVSPFFVPRLLPNMAAGNISIVFDLRGPNLAPATACASGAHAIIDAARLIERGDVEVAVCGGTESALDSAAAIGFGRLKALSSKQTSDASKPFDVDRDGFVMGEGAGVLVLESEDHFKRRQGSKVYARYGGGGMSGDAHHITSPHPSGRGAELSMTKALRDASVRPGNIGYVNAHATSTPIGDIIEAEAIARVLDQRPMVSSTKGATGHLLGAAGAAEAIFTVLSLAKGVVPATIHLSKLDPKLPQEKIDFVVNQAREQPDMQWAMSNSFGFGGTNASIVFERV
jgi:3-oxoacyl-[acyl-carrier-protein] synthase II